MSNNQQKKDLLRRHKRALRVRRRLKHDTTLPRLSVYKSNSHIAAQIIDDEKGMTLCGVATYSEEFRKTKFNKRNKESARALGERLAALAKEKNVKEVVFDRGPFKFHGILAELAQAARANGLKC